MEFLVRRCRPGDEQALSLVAQATILETYAGIAEGADLYAYANGELSVNAFRTILTSDRVRAWAAETTAGTCMIGYALVVSAEEGEPFILTELQRLYVFYRFHKLGLGRRLMDAALADAAVSGTERMTLRVNAQNENSIAFYERYGFSNVAEETMRAGERDYRVFVMEKRF